MTVAIDVEGLNKSFGGRRVVKDFSIQVEQGRITGFLGPNGSGKTTTLRMLCGLLTPDSGSGTALGFDIIAESWRDQAPHRLHDPEILALRGPDHRGEPAVQRPDPRPRPAARAGRRRRWSSSASPSGAGSSPARCRAAGSSGWRWPPRPCTSRNCCCSTSPPPASTRRRGATFWDEIHALAAAGLTVLVSTHYMDEAERCHDIAYIAYGELLARGTADEVIAGAKLCHLARRGPGRRPAGARAARRTRRSRWRRRSARAARQRQRPSGAGARASRPIAEPPFKWTRTEPTLEDVFIHLMGGVEDNFQ